MSEAPESCSAMALGISLIISLTYLLNHGLAVHKIWFVSRCRFFNESLLILWSPGSVAFMLAWGNYYCKECLF